MVQIHIGKHEDEDGSDESVLSQKTRRMMLICDFRGTKRSQQLGKRCHLVGPEELCGSISKDSIAYSLILIAPNFTFFYVIRLYYVTIYKTLLEGHEGF